MFSSTKDGARVHRRTRAAITTATALTAVAAFAGPAGATTPPAGHNLISFPQRDFVSDQGFKLSDGPVTVEVIRNGVTIATSTPVTPQDDGDPTTPFTGTVEVNHPGGGCWVNTTPDILPGDTIRMTDANGKDEQTTTANVTAQPAELVGADVVVHGTAQDASGNPLPVDQIEQRIVANKQAFDVNHRRTLRANSAGANEGILSYDPSDPVTNPKGINWTATYTGLDAADQVMATTNETRGLWLGTNPAATTEGTIYEVALDGSIIPGPAAGTCDASPFAQNAIGATKVDGALTSLINQDNAGGMLEISGPYDPVNVSGVSLTVAGAPVPVTLGTDTWTASVPAASLPEGTVALTASFTAGGTNGGGAPDNTMTILKDTVAPAAPTANLAGGTFTGPQTVVLSAGPGATIRFTGDGSTPTATSGAIFVSPFSVTASQTIKAVAVDNHGNASAPSTFAFTILGPAGARPPVIVPAAGGQPAGAQPAQQGVQGATASSPLAVSRLTLARRISLARLRVQGLRASLNVQEGTNVVRIAIYKARNGAKTGRALFTTIRTPRSAGLLRLTLRSSTLSKLKPGAYVMEVRAGRSAASLGAARTSSFQVTR